MISRLKSWGLTLLAALAVLVGAYALGGRAANRANNLRSAREEADRLRAANTGIQNAKNHTSRLPVGGANVELRRDWMRDGD